MPANFYAQGKKVTPFTASGLKKQRILAYRNRLFRTKIKTPPPGSPETGFEGIGFKVW